METETPYAPPLPDTTPKQEPILFKEMSFKELKTLYYRSRNVGVIAIFWLMGSTFMLARFMLGDDPWWRSLPWWIYLGSAIQFAAGVCILLRTSWGRIIGIIACALASLNPPIHTILGVYGLVVLTQNRKLFGPERLAHRDLKRELKRRKRNKLYGLANGTPDPIEEAKALQAACSHDYQQEPEYAHWKKCIKCGATLRKKRGE